MKVVYMLAVFFSGFGLVHFGAWLGGYNFDRREPDLAWLFVFGLIAGFIAAIAVLAHLSKRKEK